MRKIRFRVFDPSTNSYIKDISDFWVNPANFSTYMEYRKDLDGKTIFENTNFIYEQYTGLKDAVGKEIFEGDIIQVFEWDSELTNEMYRAEIIFDETEAQFAAKELSRTYTLIIGTSSHCDINVQNCKVIGNIHESKS